MISPPLSSDGLEQQRAQSVPYSTALMLVVMGGGAFHSNNFHYEVILHPNADMSGKCAIHTLTICHLGNGRLLALGTV